MNELNVELMMRVLSDILSRKYNAKVTLTAIPKEKVSGDGGK